jgi:phytoene dehydrogenase-like protein
MQIAATLLPTIRRNGGDVFVEAPVAEILTEGDRAAGIRLEDGTQVRAPIVISDAGVRNTFASLLPAHVSAGHGYDKRLAAVKDADPFIMKA